VNLSQELQRIEEVRGFAEGTLQNATGILPEEMQSSSSEYLVWNSTFPLNGS